MILYIKCSNLNITEKHAILTIPYPHFFENKYHVGNKVFSNPSEGAETLSAKYWSPNKSTEYEFILHNFG